jgi:hypothetical protein
MGGIMFRLLLTCLAAFLMVWPAPAQEKKPKEADEGHYARAEIKGQLIKMGLKEKRWNVVVKYGPGPGAFYCPLFIEDKAMKETAQRLKDKVVVVTGGIMPNPALGGLGGESFLFVPGPIILVQTLRQAPIMRDPEQVFRKARELVAALEGKNDLLKGVSRVKPDIQRDEQKRFKSARLVFANNAISADKRPARALDDSKPFFYVSVEVWAGRSQQPPADLHEFEWKGQTYQMWIRVYGSDADFIKTVRKSVDERLRGPLAPQK